MRVKDALLLDLSEDLMSWLKTYDENHFVAMDQNNSIYIFDDSEHNTNVFRHHNWRLFIP